MSIPYPVSYFDPFGDEKHCRICDGALEYDPLEKIWYCPSDHEIEKPKPRTDAKKRLEIIASLGFAITQEMIDREEKLDADYFERLKKEESTVVSENGIFSDNPNDDEGDK